MRQATLNALESLDVVADATILDLFAGSGAVGIEALSRGAAHVTFVDQAPAAVAAIRANLASTRLADRATVVHTDARRFLADAIAVGRHYDIANLDPPHVFDDWAELLQIIPAEVVVIESNREITLPEGWLALRSRRYGSTVVTFGRRPPVHPTVE